MGIGFFIYSLYLLSGYCSYLKKLLILNDYLVVFQAIIQIISSLF